MPVLRSRSFVASLYLSVALVCSGQALSQAQSISERPRQADRPFSHLHQISPYYVSRDFPRFTTPQWVGDDKVEAVVVLAIDDMRDPGHYESYLRPILERLKQIDGRAPVSIMTCQVEPHDPQLQAWVKEGVTIDCHTIDHPCPLLQNGDFEKAKSTYERCIDLLGSIPGNHPVAFRMPCCDSLNTPSPRFWAEIFEKVTPGDRFLQIDSSVFNIFTTEDPELDRSITTDANGERFRKYLPFDSFVNTIENYPYPYQIGLCWEFPCVVPSDWEAQNLHQPFNPRTVEDLKSALDATVVKQGVYNLVFHPHGWIRSEQVVELIDYSVEKYGPKVKFLSFREALDRINKNALAGHPVRDQTGADSQVRLLDLNLDGFQDVLVANERAQLTRVWQPEQGVWKEYQTPHDMRAGSTVFGKVGTRVFAVGSTGQPHVFASGWTATADELVGLEAVVAQAGSQGHSSLILDDFDGDGDTEIGLGNAASAIWDWNRKQATWQQAAYSLPAVPLPSRDTPDTGIRLEDLDRDGDLDLIHSDGEQFSVHLFHASDSGWATRAIAGQRSELQPDQASIPAIIRPDGTNNGAWFHTGHLWVQNEDTNRLPNLVDRISFSDMLANSGHQIPPPVSPEAALKTFRFPANCRLELVAAEPLVTDPVAFDWAPNGDLWVAEMRDYPNGVGWKHGDSELGPPAGRIKRLSDTDGDGRYDSAHIFLEDLPFPNGVKVWGQGILVSAAPDIFYAEDTDGDGVADLKQTLYTGFGEGNQQHRVNGLRWGIDGWLYIANGDSGGKIRSVKTGELVDLGGRDLRVRPAEGTLQLQSGQTQFGRCTDNLGNWFGGNNSNPMWHFVLEEPYLNRNPHLAAQGIRRAVSDFPGPAPCFPISRTLARFNDFDKVNRFTSACSPIIFRDDAATTALTYVCEPVHNLVHREVIQADGVSFRSSRLESERESEFLASVDNWFRPVMVRTGPDGAIWIADMYRLVIEHPTWIPVEWQERLELRAGSDRGRIYRVTFEDRPRREPAEAVTLHERTPAELVAALDSPIGTHRDLVQQLLMERAADSAVAPLKKLLMQARWPRARIPALYLLDEFDSLDEETLTGVLKEGSAEVQRHALRLAESRLDSKQIREAVLGLLNLGATRPADLQLQLQLAYTLGAFPGPESGSALSQLILAYAEHEPIWFAAFSSIQRDNVSSVVDHLVSARNDQEVSTGLLSTVLGFAIGYEQASSVNRAVTRLLPSQDELSIERLSLASALGGLLQKHRRQPGDFLEADGYAALQKNYDQARAALQHDESDHALRLAAIRLLGTPFAGQDEAVQEMLVNLVSPQNSAEIQAAALESIQRQPKASAVQALLDQWDSHSPAIRGRVLDLFLARKEGASPLLAAIRSESIPAAHLDARRQQQLLRHPDKNIQKLAAELLQASTSSRQEILDRYQPCLDLTGDASRGRELFHKQCASCHKFDGLGHSVGPDLAALTNRSPSVLLEAILDPNRAVEGKYLEYVGITADGRQVSGMIREEAGNSIRLAAPNDKQTVLLRHELEEFKSTGKSLMPEGLEKEISPQSMADIIQFLRKTQAAPKTFPGNAPQVAPVRDDGSIRLFAMHSRIYGPSVVFEPRYRNLGFWASLEDHAVWDLRVPRSGKYRVVMEFACADSVAGNRFVVAVGSQEIGGVVPGTGTWDDYQSKQIGTVDLRAGNTELLFRSDGPVQSFLIDLRALRLLPTGD